MHLTPEGGPNEGCVRSLAIGRRHNKVGVSLQERRGTTQVMLGVSLRARWDTTLVIIITVKTYVGVLQSPVKSSEPREEHENRTMKKNHKPRRAV